MTDQFMVNLHIREAITYLNDAKIYLDESDKELENKIEQIIKTIEECKQQWAMTTT